MGGITVHRGGGGAKINNAATAAPGVTDDSDSGYSAGSLWIDVTNDVGYTCLDATVGAAVWTNITDALLIE